MTRRRCRWPVVLVVTVVGVALFLAIPGAPGHDLAALSTELAASDAGTAISKVDPFGHRPEGPCAAIESSYGVGNHLLKDDPIGFYASIWPTYQALNTFFLASLQSGHGECARDFDRTLAAVDANYWSGGQATVAAYDQGPAALHVPGDITRVDDSLWMGLTLTEDPDRAGRGLRTTRAQAVLALARANWDPLHGGIYWEDHVRGATNWVRSVVSNAPAAMLAVELYRITGDRADLAWGEKVVGWLGANLLDAGTGLYVDNRDDHHRPPTVDRILLTYNQGLMVGAEALLATVSPSQYPLVGAVDLARRAERAFVAHHAYGQPALDVVWAQQVLWLASLVGDPSFAAAARASVRAAVRAEPPHPSGLLDQASEAALALLARLPPARYPQLGP